MSITRLAAIATIFVIATGAWLTLAASVVDRTGEFDERLGQAVAQLWGGRHRQQAPDVWIERQRRVTAQVTDPGNAKRARTVTRLVIDRVPGSWTVTGPFAVVMPTANTRAPFVIERQLIQRPPGGRGIRCGPPPRSPART